MTTLRDPDLHIGGIQKVRDRTIVRSPWDGREVGSVPLATAADIERAITLAWEAARRRAKSPTARHLRVEILERTASRLAAAKEPLAQLISDEAGKPITLARLEVARAIDTFCATRDALRSETGEVLPLDTFAAGGQRLGMVQRFAVGAISAITPFNFPLNLVAHKLAPAIAVDAPMVLKPAPQAPLAAYALAEMVRQAGLPDDGLTVLSCSNPLATALVVDPRIAMLSFTGSAEVGFALASLAVRKRVALELGGAAAVIVHTDANLEDASTRIVNGAFAYAGQSCISVQRVLAARPVYAELRALLHEKTRRYVVGDPAQEATRVGPVIDERAVTRIQQLLADVTRRGETQVEASWTRQVLSPVWLEGLATKDPFHHQEVFAPIATLEPYDDIGTAIDRINDSPFGLQAGVFTQDIGEMLRCFERLHMGAVLHNDVPTFRADAMPYGGVKGSGMFREGPRYAMDAMSNPRLLILRRD